MDCYGFDTHLSKYLGLWDTLSVEMQTVLIMMKCDTTCMINGGLCIQGCQKSTHLWKSANVSRSGVGYPDPDFVFWGFF